MKQIKILIIFFIGNFLNAQQNNYNFEHFGNKSILLLGNVTASVDDLGLTYYNPSRLSSVEDPIFTVNAKAYKYKKVRIEGVDDLGSGNSITDFRSIPSIAAGIFKVRNEKFAYSFITKTNIDNNFDIRLPEVQRELFPEVPGLEKFNGSVNISNSTREELIGLTWAKKISSNFSVGTTVFFSNYRNSGKSGSSYIINYSLNQYGYLETKLGFNQRSYGLFSKVGASYSLSDIEFGVNFHLPYLDLIDNGGFNFKSFLAGIGSGKDYLIDNNFSKIAAKRKTPIGIDFGTAIKLKRNKLHLKTSWYSGVSTYDKIHLPAFNFEGVPIENTFVFQEKLKPIFNFGVGAELYINKSLFGYISFTTDYSPVNGDSDNKEVFNFNSDDLNLKGDFYHYAAGINLKNSWSNITLGATYSHSLSYFDSPSSTSIIMDHKAPTKYKYALFRILVGIEVPLYRQKLKKVFDKL
ncbi:hypothetical protein VO54_01505 [Elizabethkingia miricola]|nr:hypothetical protein VO54_01505 [Elizabethkingia miricola]